MTLSTSLQTAPKKFPARMLVDIYTGSLSSRHSLFFCITTHDADLAIVSMVYKILYNLGHYSPSLT